MTALLADESLQGQYISYLRQLRPDANLLTANEVGLRRTDDRVILEWAAMNTRILVSSDRKTMIRFAYERVAQGRLMSGLVIVKQNQAVPSVVEDLLTIMEASEADEWLNQVLHLPL